MAKQTDIAAWLKTRLGRVDPARLRSLLGTTGLSGLFSGRAGEDERKAAGAKSVRKVPVDPWPTAAAGVLVVALGLGGFTAWAGTAQLAAGAIAQGMVTSATKRKTVKHLEGGIVAEIRVQEGDSVKAGDVLFTLEDTRARATMELLEAQVMAERAAEARLLAERDGADTLEIPLEVGEAAEAGNPRAQAAMASQMSLFSARNEQLGGQIDILESRIEQYEQQIEGTRAEQQAAEEQTRIIREELEGLQKLLAAGHTNRTRVLALERAVAELEGQRGSRIARISQAKVAIGEARIQMIQVREDYRRRVLEELRETQDRLVDLEQRLKSARDVYERLVIRAPIDGTVLRSAVNTVGGVVSPGEPLMDIAPAEDDLTIEARIRPTDIDIVHAGLPAQIRITAFDQRMTPPLDGTVVQVAPDIVTDQQTGVSYYVARIAVPDEELAGLQDAQLVAGMPAEIVVAAQERTALDYLLDPVRHILQRAFREM
ncbi:HlyD family type I secretion periplasmic adaptor subunit [Futiania mangrovi]|uniref:Membrane fusion protein (MFP) family protein n=1 Tax=Futiania mangrovi TaxID=2959716 RepID=A0A9J6PDU5_9PROT|nr:HlyD family type I secretion periplasmic adaptor subunit [Futiania mangrovii]MCP1335907.1 HlyD family type I secretion periplasmic adaptor subunit [Futiania mangrovii]